MAVSGLFIIGIVLTSAAITGYESVDRLFHPRPITHIGAVIIASVIGLVGNEVVARIRIGAGRAIGSASLVADGGHARIDGLTSLGVLAAAIAVSLGVPVADPIVGLRPAGARTTVERPARLPELRFHFSRSRVCYRFSLPVNYSALSPVPAGHKTAGG